MKPAAIRWRSVHRPGTDGCALEPTPTGARLVGSARYDAETGPARLEYRVACDRAWRTLDATVEGVLAGRGIRFELTRTEDDLWKMNGAPVPAVRGCPDLDLGFTPATNLLAIRRLALAVGQAAAAPAAWLDVDAATLSVLPQRYDRRSATTYWYEAPSVGYQALLEVDADGFVTRYPGLWVAEPAP
ncbi:MAG TPA: putative glycolipid-binding domain-containing protein [Polyangia bacterium]|nr:putative glycolipid-binding domain-containing protein [Polyangia bacterium]